MWSQTKKRRSRMPKQRQTRKGIRNMSRLPQDTYRDNTGSAAPSQQLGGAALY
jgi:hypothetical protein